MSDGPDASANDLVKNSNLYREFQAEREEILKHKWIESEKAGYDIGFEWALTDWILKHRSKWRAFQKSRRTTDSPLLAAAAAQAKPDFSPQEQHKPKPPPSQ